MQDIQELAERLLTPRYSPSGVPETTRLWLGQLPPGLPVDLPLPPNSRLVGSLGRTAGGRLSHADVAFDAPQDGAAVLAFYQQELSQRGWTTPARSAYGGFVPALRVTSQIFCHGPTGGYLEVSVIPTSSAHSDVRLSLELVNPGPCASPSPAETPRAASILPPLQAPAGVPIWDLGGGGGSDRWHSEARAETDLSAAELEAHFARQFQAAGWTRSAGGADGTHAWSLWRLVRDGGWQALLLVLETPGQRQRTLFVRAASETIPPGGWSTTLSSVRT